MKQKVDHFAYTVPSFDKLLLRAKRTLIAREEEWRLGCVTISPYRINTVSPVKPPPVPENNNKGMCRGDQFIIIADSEES